MVIEPHSLAERLRSELEKFQLCDGEQPIAIPNDANGFLHFSCDSFRRMKMPSAKNAKTAAPSEREVKPFTTLSSPLVPARFTQEAFDIYRLYQVTVHKDDVYRLSERQYRNFLCESPIISQPSAGPNIMYGSFHVEDQFDDKLISISVIDILPK